MQFRGREIAHVDLGQKLLQRFSADLKEVGLAEGNPKLEGRNAHVIISPLKKDAPTKTKEPEKSKEYEKPKEMAKPIPPPGTPPAPQGPPPTS